MRANRQYVIMLYVYDHCHFFGQLGHSSVGQRHDHLVNGGITQCPYKRGIDLVLVHADLRFEDLLFVAEYATTPTMVIASLLWQKYLSISDN